MIKAIVGYKVRRGEDIRPILSKLRSHVLQYPGFIGDENIQSEKDGYIVIVTNTWDRVEVWKAWEKSNIRQSLLKQAEKLLVEKPKVTIALITKPPINWID